MRVISVDDNTGRIELELDDNERALLIEYAVNNILRDYLNDLEKENELPKVD
mgnify:FL=1